MIIKKKILLVASEFAPGMIPFAATIINSLAVDNRCEVYAICVCSNNKSYKGLIDQKANVSYIEHPSSKIKRICNKIWPRNIICEIKKIQKNYNPQIVHFLTGDFSMALFVRLYRNKNFCYTIHDLQPHERKKIKFVRWVFRQIVEKGCNTMHRLIENLTTSSRYQFDILNKLYPSKNVQYTPFPTLVTDNIAKGIKSVSELENEKPYILFFGRVLPYKGTDLLISAYNEIYNEFDAKLVIAGPGTDTYKTQNEKIIRINRFIDDSEIAFLFNNAKFIVYPYISATMSGVLSLAFYFNKIVLSSDVPFFKEYECENIFYFKNGNISDLKNKMKALLTDNPSASNLCYNRFYSKYSMNDAYLDFYNKVK